MKETIEVAIQVDKDWGLKVQGYIVNLFEFRGIFTFEGNTVTDNHVPYHNCLMLDHDLSGLTSNARKTVQTKVLIAVEEYDHHIGVASNKFHRNSGTKGIIYFDDQKGNSHALGIIANEFFQNTGMY